MTGARGRGILLGALVAIAAVGTLTGCVQQAHPTPTRSHSAAPAPTGPALPSTSPTPVPGPTQTSAPGGTPVSIDCDTVETPQVIYDFNPNYTLYSAYVPASSSPAATAVADKGVACTWLNNTSRDTITVSIARPAAAALASLKAQAAKGTAASGYGDAAYFSAGGRIDVFKGGYWVALVSDYFDSAADADSLIKQALSVIG